MAYNNTLEVFEILNKVSEAKKRQDKIDILQKYRMPSLTDVLRGIFDDRVQWNLPNGTPPYTPSRDATHPKTLRRSNVNFKYLVKGIYESENMLKPKREKIFIDMLETVHPEDAKLLVSMINKKNPVKGLTKKIVQEAYPGLIP